MSALTFLIIVFANVATLASSVSLGLDNALQLLPSKANSPYFGLGTPTLENGHFPILHTQEPLGVRTKRQFLVLDKTQHVANKLHVVFKRLKSFIHKTYFAHLEFKDQKSSFGIELSEISQIHHELFQENQRLRFRLEFTSFVFSALERATHDMEVYNFLGQTDQQLLNYVIELNVRLFTFYDSMGGLDYLVPRYTSRISTCWNQLYSWSEAFYKIPDTSDEIRQTFDYYRLRANSKLDELWRQVPYGRHEL